MERVLAVKSATYLACPIGTFAIQDCRAPLLLLLSCRLSHSSGATQRIPVGDQAARAFASLWYSKQDNMLQTQRLVWLCYTGVMS